MGKHRASVRSNKISKTIVKDKEISYVNKNKLNQISLSNGCNSTQKLNLTVQCNNNNEVENNPAFKPCENEFNIFISNYNYNLNQQNLRYRGEGNANLVLSLPETKLVLRLRKSCITNDLSEPTFDLKNFIEYAKLVGNFFGDNYTCQPNLVKFEVDNIQNFNNWLANFRPVSRLNKEIKCSYGTLYPDVAFLREIRKLRPSKNNSMNVDSLSPTFAGISNNENEYPTYCVEIKPKQGWSFTDENELVKSKIFDKLQINSKIIQPTKCRYCCMQYLKKNTGVISDISSYCPLDLFSGNVPRMERAIFGLIATPQNNLRIFKNGELVYGDKTSSKKETLDEVIKNIFKSNGNCNSSRPSFNCCGNETKLEEYDHKTKSFVNLLIKMMLNNYDEHIEHNESNGENVIQTSKKCHETNEIDTYNQLDGECLLKKILKLQLLVKTSLKELDSFDENKTLDEYICGIINKANKFYKSESNLESLVSNNNSIRMTEFIDSLDNNERYLIGATALDCSMMLTFKQPENSEILDINKSNSSSIIKCNNNYFHTDITIMDLDPKATTHYRKYLKQTELSYLSHYSFVKQND